DRNVTGVQTCALPILQDLKGNIQSYVARDSIGEENYKEFKKLDVGDVIGIEGEVFKTKTGEMSIHASHVTLLSKSLQILPEKFRSEERRLGNEWSARR